ncbi:MAG: type I polyketide synthase, partial [Actinomycetes bacterium]
MTEALRDRLDGLPGPERRRRLTALVLEQAGVAEADLSFVDLGFDSLAAVDLHRRLVEATGLTLPVTIAFEQPSPRALAGHLDDLLFGGAPAVSAAPGAATTEPIAIVGLSVRLPGGIGDGDAYWTLLDSGGEVWSEFPANRGWPPALYDPDPDHAGTTYAQGGGFLHDADGFDARFFELSAREALAMDPQQRVVLEAAWAALEDAGLPPDSLRGSRTGVFLGAEDHDYGPRVDAAPEAVEGYVVTGTAASVLSGRVSYQFGFEGPSLTVDTACSASLVALHLAVQSLRRGESTLALAGGVAVMASPS